MRKIETTTDLLDALRERHGWTSDNQLAKGLGIPQGTVANWRIGRTFPTEVHAFTIANALDLGELGPLYVLAVAAADRTRSDKKTHEAWLAQIARFVSIVGLTIGAAVSAGYTPPVKAAEVDPAIHSANRKRRRPADPLAA